MDNRTKTLILFFSVISTFALSQQVKLLKDFNAGPVDSYNEWNYKGIDIGNKLMFPIVSEELGEELGYFEDGKLEIFKDINPGTGSSEPQEFIRNGDKIYFSAYDTASGGTLWVCDGTDAGTKMVYDPGGGNSNLRPKGLIAAKSGSLYFTFNKSLYRYKDNQGKKLLSSVEFKEIYQQRDRNYCQYGDEIAFVREKNNNELELIEIVGDTFKILATIPSTSGFADVFGLNQNELGLAFGVEDAFVADAMGTFVYDKIKGELNKIEIAGNSARRIHDYTSNNSIVWIGGEGYYTTNGVEGNEKRLFESSNTIFTQGEDVKRAIWGPNILFEVINSMGERELIYSDGKMNERLLDVPEYNSDFISKTKHSFLAIGTSNLATPKLYYFNLENGEKRLLHNFNAPSRRTKSIQLVGILNDQLFFVSSLDASVGKEMYSIKLDVISATKDKQQKESDKYRLEIRDDELICLSDNSEPVEFQIFSVDGRRITSISGETNVGYRLTKWHGAKLVIAKVNGIHLTRVVAH